MRALDRDYLIESCTFLARLFTANTLEFSTCLLCWGYLMKNYTVLVKSS